MNPSFKALVSIFKGPNGEGNPSIVIFDYQQKEAFNDLWLKGLDCSCMAINGMQVDWNNSSSRILIVGNDPPEGVFEQVPSLHGHFTANSWLAAWKVRRASANARIAIVDPRRSDLGGSTARALQTLFGAKDVAGKSLDLNASVLSVPSLEAIFDWLYESANGGNTVSSELPIILKFIIWGALTSDRERHHAANNVLGSLLLRSEVGGMNPPKEVQKIQELLLALCKASGVHTPMKNQGVNRWIEPDLSKRIPGIVLIDDMADIWHGFLGAAIGGNLNKVRTTRADKFIESLQGCISEQRGWDPSKDELKGLPGRLTSFLKSGRHRLSSTDLLCSVGAFEGDSPAPWDDFILFLDLRLGLGEPFFKMLSVFGVTLLKSNRRLPWLNSRQRDELERDVESGSISNTILPRLIALLDPTLPIIIFSSTHCADLIDPFRDYGNIITVLRKPILSGMVGEWTEVVKELRGNFTKALEQGVRILKTRRDISKLEIIKPFTIARLKNAPRQIVEIYIDESGDPFNPNDPGFAVGGIILQHPNREAQKSFHQAVNRYPKKWGVSDFRDDRITEDQADEKLPKIAFFSKIPAPGGAEELEGLTLAVSALNRQSQIAAFALVEPDLLRFVPDNHLNSGILFDRNSLDNVYHFLLRTNLEMLLFQHPWVDLNSDSIFVHVATREQPVSDFNTRKTWQHAYGLKFSKRQTYSSLRGDSVFRLIREILQARNFLDGKRDIVMARGATLNDYEDVVRNWRKGSRDRVNSQLYDPTRVDPHQIHYLADWTVRIALYRAKALPEMVKPWFEAGYIQALSPEFIELFHACRLSVTDKAVGYLSGVSLTPALEVEGSLRAERYLRQTAGKWADDLTGNQLRSLFARS